MLYRTTLLGVMVLLGCQGIASSVDGGAAPADAGSALDAGGVLDAGGALDAGPLLDAGVLSRLSFALEKETPEHIAFYLKPSAAIGRTAKVAVRYKLATAAAWRIGHPLLRIDPGAVTSGAPETPVDSFAGTIFDLAPGTAYDVELTLTENGRADERQIERVTTRALPPAASAATISATPADDLQAKLDSLTAGGVLELADGLYTVGTLVLRRSGTEQQKIFIRGRSRAGVVVKAAMGVVFQVQDASHVVLENLTIQGSGIDSGTNASSIAVSFWAGAAGQDDLTFRQLDIRGVDMGIVAWARTSRLLVYDCDLKGNNVWTAPFIQTNLTWNDDGVRLPGQGNCAFENTLNGFGDSFAVVDGVHSAAVYFYRNRVTMTGDDAFEADYGTRNLGFYDNNLTNCATFLSLDPLWGGPLYAFRNVVVNTIRGPLKLNSTNAGFAIYNNTIVRTEGTTGWGWVQFNNGSLSSWAYRNNLLLYRGAGTKMLAIESGANSPIDFTNNGWFPDGSVWWSTSGGSYTSLGAAASGLPATTPLFSTSTKRHDHDVIVASDPFVTPVALGVDHLTEVVIESTPTLRSGGPAKNGGVEITGITDGFSGSAPDMGAIIEGRPVARWGAHRP